MWAYSLSENFWLRVVSVPFFFFRLASLKRQTIIWWDFDLFRAKYTALMMWLIWRTRSPAGKHLGCCLPFREPLAQGPAGQPRPSSS